MPKPKQARDYKTEYQSRIAKGVAAGKTKNEASGHKERLAKLIDKTPAVRKQGAPKLKPKTVAYRNLKHLERVGFTYDQMAEVTGHARTDIDAIMNRSRTLDTLQSRMLSKSTQAIQIDSNTLSTIMSASPKVVERELKVRRIINIAYYREIGAVYATAEDGTSYFIAQWKTAGNYWSDRPFFIKATEYERIRENQLQYGISSDYEHMRISFSQLYDADGNVVMS
jgi:hypothetical protein